MKRCRVKINKTMSNNGQACTNTYPPGYDYELMEVLCYEHIDTDGDGILESYCMCLVPDDFSFTAEMVEVTKTDFDSAIDKEAAAMAVTYQAKLTANPEFVPEITPTEMMRKYKTRKEIADTLETKIETIQDRKLRYVKN